MSAPQNQFQKDMKVMVDRYNKHNEEYLEGLDIHDEMTIVGQKLYIHIEKFYRYIHNYNIPQAENYYNKSLENMTELLEMYSQDIQDDEVVSMECCDDRKLEGEAAYLHLAENFKEEQNRMQICLQYGKEFHNGSIPAV